jgi:hypothetical protein
MLRKSFNHIYPKDTPRWFRLLNLATFLPVLLWPLVFYATIFFFDNPRNLQLTYLAFFAVNAYPLYLVIIAYLNSRLFIKNNILGLILPLTIIIGGAYILMSTTQAVVRRQEEVVMRNNERKKQGFIGVSDDYKIVDNKVFRYDTLIDGADAKTFEIVTWDWQRDKNYYYRLGKRVPVIDRETFEILAYHYGKDKKHVYYDERIIDGADAKTFYHIEGSQDGKDAHNCYRWGKKVDCKVLETIE